MKLDEISQKNESIWTPDKNNGDVSVVGKHLMTLQGAPKNVFGNFNCRNNHLNSLVGGPNRVREDYLCDYNTLKTLDGVAQYMNCLFCTHNQLTNLHNIHKMIKACNEIYAQNNPIKHSVLGLLLIDGLSMVVLSHTVTSTPLLRVEIILNEYLDKVNMDKHTKILECQDELIDAGLEPFARL